MHKDIFKYMHMENEMIKKKVQYWKGMKDKVLTTIKRHISSTLQRITKEVTTGKS